MFKDLHRFHIHIHFELLRCLTPHSLGARELKGESRWGPLQIGTGWRGQHKNSRCNKLNISKSTRSLLCPKQESPMCG